MPLVIPSVNMNNGDVVCFSSSKIRNFSNKTIFVNDANIGECVQASCSFPTVFSPCSYKDIKLVDGGIRENTPWRELKMIGADDVISVVFENEVDNNCCKNLVDVAFRSFELLPQPPQPALPASEFVRFSPNEGKRDHNVLFGGAATRISLRRKDLRESRHYRHGLRPRTNDRRMTDIEIYDCRGKSIFFREPVPNQRRIRP